MKLRLVYLGVITILLAGTFTGCQKDILDESSALEELNNPELPVTIESAKVYLKNLRKLQGNSDVPLKKSKSVAGFSKNKKFVIFSKAYSSETSTATFIETPILYNRRSVPLIRTKDGTKDPQIDAKVCASSMDRFVIFKDKKTGKVNNFIVTFLPNEEYLIKRNGDISRNHINRLDRDFGGFLIYKNWKGKIISMREVRDGKIIYRKKSEASNVNTVKLTKNNAQVESYSSICDWVCTPVEIDIYEQICYYANPEGTFEQCTYGNLSTEIVTLCTPQQDPPAGCTTVPNVQEEPYITPDPYNEGGVICPELSQRPTENCISAHFPGYGPAGSDVRFEIFGVYVLPGNTWIVFENINTNVQYKAPIAAPDGYLMYPCLYWWYVTIQLPSDIPPGKYYMKWECDGEVFEYGRYTNDQMTTFVKSKFTVTP
ncbi:hypothetical protein [Pedobacter punctiformis]|uniref:Lipoprotein n=1 Tax=Pedobacter punctiformis TaxID=3004097 RepID=A0ABT4L7A7_9SPHI|nr:hypothetical protein [Pedobacter sp. HCMS5-2]MCZ4243804.1 hypothetical protein [Pedobacter sp. HCMS5-2]